MTADPDYTNLIKGLDITLTYVRMRSVNVMSKFINQILHMKTKKTFIKSQLDRLYDI